MSATQADTKLAPNQAVRIFQSYGWNDATEISHKLKESLAEAGYTVWLDREQLRQDDKHFSIALEDAVKECDVVIALISPHSARGPADWDERSSICYNELRLAEELPRPIVPIRVRPLGGPPPFIVIKYRRIDWTAWESPESYEQGFHEILATLKRVLAGDKNLDPDIAFQTTSFITQLLTARNAFVGRAWLFERIQKWLSSDNKLFMIEAATGTGKTAIAAELVRHNPGGRILAYHFCGDVAVTADPAGFVRSIAAMIANSIDSYATLLWKSGSGWFQGTDPYTMLSQGLLAPLHSQPMDQSYYIVVDGLDEALASRSGRLSLPQLLALTLEQFPSWLKLLVTTRPHAQIQSLFHEPEICVLNSSIDAQRQDLRAYIQRRLADLALQAVTAGQDVVSLIEERAASNFQYASSVLEALAKGEIAISDLRQLPDSLGSLYARRAVARFPDPRDYRLARIILELQMAAREPLTLRQLQRFSGLDRDLELQPTLDALTAFIAAEPGGSGEIVYRIAHKSIGDWLLSPQANRFSIELEAGRERLLTHCRKWAEHHDAYALRHVVGHLLEEGRHPEALAVLAQGLFKERQTRLREPRLDALDSHNITLALVAARDQAAILALARTENTWQRDGIAAALQSTQAEDLAFVDQVTGALLELKL